MSISSIVADEYLYDEIKKSSETVAANWPEMITAEDVQQQMWFYLLKDNAAILRELNGLKGPLLSEALEMLAARAVSKEQIDYDYFTGNFFYSTNDVHELLKRGALTEGRERTWTERQDLDRGMEALESRYRVSLAAWEASRNKGNKMQKPMDYAEVIRRRYVTEDFDASTGSARKTLTRSVDALTREMNRAHGKYSNPERFRQKPTTEVTIRNKHDQSVNYTRELTDAEWDKTAEQYAKDLAAYNRTRPYGGPGSRTIRIGTPERIDPDKASDPDENEIRVVEPEYLEDSF